MFLLLRSFETPLPSACRKVTAIFGAAPMFFYLLHLYVLLLLHQGLLGWLGPNQGQSYGVAGILRGLVDHAVAGIAVVWADPSVCRVKKTQ